MIPYYNLKRYHRKGNWVIPKYDWWIIYSSRWCGAIRQYKVKFQELRDLGLLKAFYWKIRQNQWLSFNNKSTKIKLEFLTRDNPLEGTLRRSILIDK
mgnify:CR=1 FL=1